MRHKKGDMLLKIIKNWCANREDEPRVFFQKHHPLIA